MKLEINVNNSVYLQGSVEEVQESEHVPAKEGTT